jgi:glycosyltransferase involved in cell wall biosynthesis
MEHVRSKISACLVVYNEDKVIDRCLASICNLVDEIILVHDGECSDRTLEIAKKYTDKIFVQPHIGEAEPHRAFTFLQASGDWILQIDADEFLDIETHSQIRKMVGEPDINVDAYSFQWELWNGNQPVHIPGFYKMCLFKKKNFFYCGVPHQAGGVKGKIQKVDLFLRHRPAYNNTAWKEFLRKAKKWVPVHAKYFFPQLVQYNCFNTTADAWLAYAAHVRKHPILHLFYYPAKTSLAQLKNGMVKSWAGWNSAAQQFVYYSYLFIVVLMMKSKIKNL